LSRPFGAVLLVKMAAAPRRYCWGGTLTPPGDCHGDPGERDGRSFRNPSSGQGAPPRELVCILNFTMVPNMTVLQRKLDQARADALVMTGSGDVDIRTRITSSARRCPREWYINGCRIGDEPGSIRRLSSQTRGGGDGRKASSEDPRSPAASGKRSSSQQTGGGGAGSGLEDTFEDMGSPAASGKRSSSQQTSGSGAGSSLEDPGSPAASWTRSVTHEPPGLLGDETNKHMLRFISDGNPPHRRADEGGGDDSFHSLMASEDSAARSARGRSNAAPSRARRLASWTRSLLPRRSSPVAPVDSPAAAP